MKTTSDNGIKLITEFEGEILKVYLDPVGLPTFGVGHLVKPDERAEFPVGKKITRATSREYLKADLARFETCVNSQVNVPITQNQFDALVSFAFNVGEKNFKRSSVLRNLNNRQFAKAADSLLAWNRSKGRVLPGLVRRRKAERALFLTPDSATDAPTNEPQTDAKQTAETPATQLVSDTPLPSNIVNVPEPQPYQGVGFWAVIKRDLTAATGGNLTFSGLSEYAQQASGWPEWVIAMLGKLAVGALIATVGYFVFRVVHYLVDSWKQKERVKLLATINTDPATKDLKLV